MIQKIHPVLWRVICLVTAVIFFSLMLVPNLSRPTSMSLRTGFGIVIPSVGIVLLIVFSIPGRLGKIISLSTVMSIFALSLAGLWASGQTLSIMINGLIPISDAVSYYTDALRISYGMSISDFTAMRPLFASFLSFLLFITGRNLITALAIVTAIAGLASFLSSKEIQRTHGPVAAVFFLILMFLYFRHHSGTTMTESFGLPVSLLGLGLIWGGVRKEKQWEVLTGIALIALALNIRPGAMFVLPALLIWGGFVFRAKGRFSFRFFILGAILTASAFILNNIMIRILAGPNASAFSNFSWALYGLVSGGKSWTYIFEANPEGFETTSVYQLILAQFFQHPELALQGAIKYWRFFFSSSWYNAYSFVGGGNYWVNEAARYGMYLLNGIGIYHWWKNRTDPYASLAIFGALGVLASVPFVPPTDAYRVRLYAATIPFFALLPAMGMYSLFKNLKFKWLAWEMESSLFQPNSIATLSGILLFFTIIPAILLQSTDQRFNLPAVACPNSSSLIVVNFDKGTYINIHRGNVEFLDWMPNYHVGLFRNNAHDLADLNLTWQLKEINPPATLIATLDLASNHEALIIVDSKLLPPPGVQLSMCGTWETEPELTAFNIFHAESIEIVKRVDATDQGLP